MEERAKKAGHTETTMRRAREHLKVKPYQLDGKWWQDLENGSQPEVEEDDF